MSAVAFPDERYAIEDELGRGAMGRVYRAHDRRLNRRVALKLLVEASPLAKRRLVREAHAVAAFAHPNAVAIHDFGDEGGQPFIAMELVEGRVLRSLVGDASLPWSVKLGWMLDVARALGAAHAAGLVHRDVKPENVMLSDDGRIKVLDFGIARRTAAAKKLRSTTGARGLGTLTAKGLLVGTPQYMAPEYVQGAEIDARADQFSWAVMTYEMLTGRLPWSSDNVVEMMAAILLEAAPPLGADVPSAVEAVLLRALAKDPAERHADMAAVVAALEPYANGKAQGAPSVPIRAHPDPRRRTRWLALAGVAVGLTIGVSAPLAFTHYQNALRRAEAPAASSLSVRP